MKRPHYHKNLKETDLQVRKQAEQIIACGRNHSPALKLFDEIRSDRIPEVEIFNSIFKVLRHARRMPVCFGNKIFFFHTYKHCCLIY